MSKHAQIPGVENFSLIEADEDDYNGSFRDETAIEFTPRRGDLRRAAHPGLDQTILEGVAIKQTQQQQNDKKHIWNLRLDDVRKGFTNVCGGTPAIIFCGPTRWNSHSVQNSHPINPAARFTTTGTTGDESLPRLPSYLIDREEAAVPPARNNKDGDNFRSIQMNSQFTEMPTREEIQPRMSHNDSSMLPIDWLLHTCRNVPETLAGRVLPYDKINGSVQPHSSRRISKFKPDASPQRHVGMSGTDSSSFDRRSSRPAVTVTQLDSNIATHRRMVSIKPTGGNKHQKVDKSRHHIVQTHDIIY